MNPERWRQVKDIFGQARRLPASERSTFVGRRCDGDSGLEHDVRDLLDAKPTEGFLDTPELPVNESDENAAGSRRRLGDCELIEELGRGGMGRVYRARELTLGRDVAVKVMAGMSSLDPRAGERFELEASAAARLDHPSIVRIHRVERTDDDERYIVMELLPGHDLHKEIDAQRSLPDSAADASACILPAFGSAPYMAAVARLCLQVADALCLSHERLLLHRDVKPHNIVLRPDGRPCLVDFGLARDHATDGHTQTGEIRGTPAYMSPEQILSLSDVDGRTDVYSLGIVLYELLTLRAAFAPGPRREDLYARVLEGPPTAPRKLVDTVPRDLETICQRAIQTRRRDRYASMQELRDDLAAFLEHRAIQARPLSMPERLARHGVRRRRRYLAGLVIVALLVATISATRARDKERRRDELAQPWLAWVEQDLSTQPPNRVLELDGALRRSLTEFPEGAHADAARQLAGRVRAYGEALRARGLKLIEDSQGDKRRTTSLTGLFEGLATLESASGLLPDDALLAAQARRETWFPRVRCELHLPPGVAPNDVSATYSDVDIVWGRAGPAQAMPARWRDSPVRMAPGPHRFRFSAPGVGSVEITRQLLRWNNTEVVEVWLRPDDPTELGDMLLIPAGDPIVGFDYPRFPWMRRGPVSIESFWIDVTEVTNRQYLDFVRATGATRPRHWGDGAYDNAWDDLPVIGVTFQQARAYAEWRGKRLPTWVEWDAAARGRDDLPRPAALVGLSPAELARRCLVNRPRPTPGPGRDDGEWPGYFEQLRPVGSHPADASPHGVLDMLGSVAEWTESPFVTNVNGQPHADPGARMTKGESWRSSAFVDWVFPRDTNINAQEIGFRCVRSARARDD